MCKNSCLHVCMGPACGPDIDKGPKIMLDLLELELQIVVNHYEDTRNQT